MSVYQEILADDPNAQEHFNEEVQTILASTILEIDQLSDTAISDLAEEFQYCLKDSIKNQKLVILHRNHQMASGPLFLQIQQVNARLIQVKFHLTLLLQLYLHDKQRNQAIIQIQQDVRKFRKVILLFESQMNMILWVLNNSKASHFKEKYFQKYNELHQFAISIDSINQGFINVKMIMQALQAVKQIFTQYLDSILELQKSIQKKRRAKYLLRGLNRLCVINAKIITVSEVMPYCCTVQIEDLFSYPPDHQRWKKLISECIVYRSYADKQTLKKSFDNFKKNLNLVNATMGILNKTRQLSLSNLASWIHIAKSSKYLLKLILFSDAAKKQAQYMISSANTQLMKQVWNLPEHRVFRDFAQFQLPSIQHSERLYIPRTYKKYFNSNGIQQLPSMKILFLNDYGNILFKKANYQQRLRIRINSKFTLKPKFQIIDQKIKGQSQGNGLFVQRIFDTFHKIKSMCNNNNSKPPEKLIFHIHGGGFISMSSFIHQVYTRNWANQLEVPIISVDYGKAPQHPYPQGLYDCLEAYMWILTCFQQVYQIKPKHILFLGDSAGGNLAAALINLCIAWKIRMPDGLVMCYPVLSVTSKKYTKSLLGTLQDMILPHTLLKLCQSSYAINKQNPKDPLISPLFTSNQFLAKFPQTKIFVGTKDPFHDDCFRFTQRMNNINPGNCSLTIFEQFPHGFLQFDIKTHPNEFGRKANDEICNSIKSMFDKLDQQII